MSNRIEKKNQAIVKKGGGEVRVRRHVCGDGGGTVIAKGTPEEVAKDKDSYTGYYIKRELKRAKEREKLRETSR